MQDNMDSVNVDTRRCILLLWKHGKVTKETRENVDFGFWMITMEWTHHGKYGRYRYKVNMSK